MKKQFNGDQGSVTCGEHQIVNMKGEWNSSSPISSIQNTIIQWQISKLTAQDKSKKVKWDDKKDCNIRVFELNQPFIDSLIKWETSVSLKSDTRRTFVGECTGNKKECLNKLVPFCLEMRRQGWFNDMTWRPSAKNNDAYCIPSSFRK